MASEMQMVRMDKPSRDKFTKARPFRVLGLWCFKWDIKSSKVCFRFVVYTSSLLSLVIL